VPADFIADREQLSGRPFDMAAMKAAAPPMKAQWRAHAAWIERGLCEQRFPRWINAFPVRHRSLHETSGGWAARRRAPSQSLLEGLPKTTGWQRAG